MGEVAGDAAGHIRSLDSIPEGTGSRGRVSGEQARPGWICDVHRPLWLHLENRLQPARPGQRGELGGARGVWGDGSQSR